MNHTTPVIRFLLLPLSWIYGVVVYIRNLLFDWGILKSKEYDVPVICVGNISVGGTGKTPHVEYLIELLSKSFNVAVISRGYKRTTTGFISVTAEHSAAEVGDEPRQIKLKYPAIQVAVDEDRRRGIDTLLNLYPDIEVVIMDDGFQHRYVKPHLSILLTNHAHLPQTDTLLPAGRLRESYSQSKERVNIFLITKTPANLKPLDYMLLSKEMGPFAFQSVFFSRYDYQPLRPVYFDEMLYTIHLDNLSSTDVLLIAGIANPTDLINHLNTCCKSVTPLLFEDHRDFTTEDINTIKKQFHAIRSKNKLVITTEKDAVKFINHQLSDEEIKAVFYYLSIKPRITKEDDFNKIIVDFIKNFKQKRKPSI